MIVFVYRRRTVQGVDINRWESEWKTQGGGASAWLCGSSKSIKISQNNIVMIDTIIFMVVRNVLKRIEKLFSITA
jgi:hypothetical protein